MFIDFYTLFKAYPDIPLHFIEDLLYKRDDLTKSQVKEALESILDRMNEVKRRADEKPSLFSRLIK